MIEIFKELQLVRNQEKIFQKNEVFITIRDLIKWEIEIHKLMKN